MKKKFPLTLRQALPIAVTLLLLLLTLLYTFLRPGAQSSFDKLTASFLQTSLEANTIDLHYTLAYPEQYGIAPESAKLPLYSLAQERNQQLYQENLFKSLIRIPYRKLRPQDQTLLRQMAQSLHLSLKLSEYTYFAEPLSPAGGMHTQLPILLSEYTFRSEQDVLDYLELLAQMEDYFQSLLVFETEKKQAGLIMAASSLDKVISQCDTVVTNEQLMQGAHFLQTGFRDRLQSLSKEIGLDEAKQKAYEKKNEHLLKTVVLPAYQHLADGLFLLRDTETSLQGLAAYQGGREYYQLLLAGRVGTYRSPEDIKALYLRKLRQEYDSLYAILSSDSQVAEAYLDRNYLQLPLNEPAEILADLEQRMSTDFPSYCINGQEKPEIIVKEVAANLQEFSAPAFYLTVPFDDCDRNVVYINPGDNYNDLELYTTLAHEALPGHLYQSVFRSRYFVQMQENPAKALLWYGGYLEGWALYVEFLSYDYAAELLQSEHRLADSKCVEMEKHNRSMQLCLYALLDYLIHYENASPADMLPYLEPFGITDPAMIQEIYACIVEDPCNYPMYYLGYLEICELKAAATQVWGNSYSDYRFHSFLLENGPADFPSLENKLQESKSLFTFRNHALQVSPIPE